MSNCLSCGKIVCEQEGEGPCSFCGALVLKEGSTYAGLTDFDVPLSKEEEAAEEYAKRLVDYDRDSTARTKVIDDQSDYYEIEGNSWLSTQVHTLTLFEALELKLVLQSECSHFILFLLFLLGERSYKAKAEGSRSSS